ncbi:hypothetical protein [Streptomyces sp. NPDC088360]|uniref:hypothetical protein n=1 Tax=Streptomyces sp. NPDC088360 TaxID=3154515 RepID=UPI00344D4B3F
MRAPFRLVRTAELQELRDAAASCDIHAEEATELERRLRGLEADLIGAFHLISGLRGQLAWVHQRTAVLAGESHVDALLDEVQVHILRRALAIELLQEIDPGQLPPEVAEQIRLACEALTRGGEVVST